MDFVVGGLAACSAGLFTNPFDLIKTRQQLHGELSVRKSGPNLYKNVWSSARTIIKTEGILALQKGLSAALSFQFVMNSTRLGLFETLSIHGLTRNKDGQLVPIRLIFCGGLCGVAGASAAAPFYLVKTQIQAMSKGEAAVGFQHNHRGTFQALGNIFQDGGLRGLWRGTSGLVCRIAMGSAVQLSTFTECKDFCQRYEIFRKNDFLTTVGASVVSGFFLVVFMTPFDVISTRLFNQGVDERGRGLLYRNIFDCFVKTFRVEGFWGLYKGFMPMFYRAAPHTILNLTFWEQFKKWKRIYIDEFATKDINS
ncbi:solute carrier family 25 member 35-like [Lutzomyia longipalpis]|nr:solute carrier family 25 member 35-like [Lutzomyia longipalpis]